MSLQQYKIIKRHLNNKKNYDFPSCAKYLTLNKTTNYFKINKSKVNFVNITNLSVKFEDSCRREFLFVVTI